MNFGPVALNGSPRNNKSKATDNFFVMNLSLISTGGSG